MANHSKHARSSTFAMPSKSSLVKIAATVAAVGLLATGGIVSRNLYTSAEQNTANQSQPSPSPIPPKHPVATPVSCSMETPRMSP